MEQRPQIARAIAIAEGIEDASDLAWLRAGFRRATRDGVPLEVALGLPTSTAGWRRAARDYWLQAAASVTPGATRWARAVNLDQAARRFEQRLLPRWRRLGRPPGGASLLHVPLWHLAACGGEVPRARRLDALLAGFALFAQDNATALALPSGEHVDGRGTGTDG